MIVPLTSRLPFHIVDKDGLSIPWQEIDTTRLLIDLSDLSHYQKQEFACLVLCGSRRRAELLQEMLRGKNLTAFLAIPLESMPGPGQILLTEGTLPFGMEYPTARLAVLTEGQLIYFIYIV